jgi:hypothetical protein
MNSTCRLSLISNNNSNKFTFDKTMLICFVIVKLENLRNEMENYSLSKFKNEGKSIFFNKFKLA